MPRRTKQESFSVNMLVDFKFLPGASYKEVQQFIKDAKEDIEKLFDHKVEIEIGKTRIEKRIIYP